MDNNVNPNAEIQAMQRLLRNKGPRQYVNYNQTDPVPFTHTHIQPRNRLAALLIKLFKTITFQRIHTPMPDLMLGIERTIDRAIFIGNELTEEDAVNRINTLRNLRADLITYRDAYTNKTNVVWKKCLSYIIPFYTRIRTHCLRPVYDIHRRIENKIDQEVIRTNGIRENLRAIAEERDAAAAAKPRLTLLLQMLNHLLIPLL